MDFNNIESREYVDKIKKERESLSNKFNDAMQQKNISKALERLCRTSCKHFNVSRWCREYFVL